MMALDMFSLSTLTVKDNKSITLKEPLSAEKLFNKFYESRSYVAVILYCKTL